MRTFIAIEIPDGIKTQMAGLQDNLRKAPVDASWPRPEGMHLTLKFLGEVRDEQASPLEAALRNAVAGFRRFRLEIRGVGTFPNPRNARVVWLGLEGELDRLKDLQSAVEESMVRAGLAPEERPFTPHLTLGRIKYIRSKADWLRVLESVKEVRLPDFEVLSVCLMKSELKRAGAAYTELAKIELE